jgi:hypothetical protein
VGGAGEEVAINLFAGGLRASGRVFFAVVKTGVLTDGAAQTSV